MIFSVYLISINNVIPIQALISLIQMPIISIQSSFCFKDQSWELERS